VPFGEHALTFELTSDRFDHSSELPPDANAGNRFYGRDVAELVADGLRRRGFETSFIDEDWGWQAHASRADGSILEVSISHNPEEDPAREDDWALLVRSLRKEKALGFLSRFREVEVDPEAVSALEDVFQDAGIALRRRPE
jgi:hypothetical protein